MNDTDKARLEMYRAIAFLGRTDKAIAATASVPAFASEIEALEEQLDVIDKNSGIRSSIAAPARTKRRLGPKC